MSVVCHNTSADLISSLIAAHAGDPRLRILELQDGIRSPTGPFNLGLDEATARFTSVMGSDDELEPGAVDSWLARADRDDAAAVIPRLRLVGGRDVPTPPVRPGRVSALDAVRDRLSYRSAPLGLVSTEHFGAERFVPGVGSGEDVAYVTAVWFSGHRISFDRSGPAYLVHDDAGDRVTMGLKSVAADVAFLRLLVDDPRFTGLDHDQTLALVLKLLRIHIFGIVNNRMDTARWSDEDRRDLRDMTARLIAIAPLAPYILSRSDNLVLDAIDDLEVPVRLLIERARLRRRFLRPGSLVSRNALLSLAREAPVRMIAASAGVRGLR